MDKQSGKIKKFLNFLYDYYKKMEVLEVIIAYEGIVTHQIIETFTTIIDQKLSSLPENNLIKKKVINIVVESLQNISKHGDGAKTSSNNNINNSLHIGKGVFLFNYDDTNYNIASGNIIDNDILPTIKNSLKLINSLDEEGLKELYIDQLRSGELSKKQGAGLGFIDIARKAGGKLKYHFFPLTNEVSFFLLISSIPKK